MNKRRKIFLGLCFVAIGGFVLYCFIIVPPSFGDPLLEFPFEPSGNVYEFEPYGVLGWDGPNTYHSGIDIKNNATVNVVSPVKGVVVGIFEMSNQFSTDKNINYNIIIQYNWQWFVILTLEPHFPGTDTVNNTLQRNAIFATLFKRYNAGDVVAQLLYGNFTNHYSHLHFILTRQFQDACPYLYSSPAAQDIYEAIATRAGCDICLEVDRSQIYFQTPLLMLNLPFIIIGIAAIIIIPIALISRIRRKKRLNAPKSPSA